MIRVTYWLSDETQSPGDAGIRRTIFPFVIGWYRQFEEIVANWYRLIQPAIELELIP